MTTLALRKLRDTVPLRALTQSEALRVAELQANRLLELSGLDKPPVPESIISGLPRVQVERMIPSFASGASQWSSGRWLILLAGAEPLTRQRFSLAHEFKHVLDNPFVSVLYPPTSGRWTQDRIERVCDGFAACLLMPRSWVKRLYCDEGVQDLLHLARRFKVSPAAMQVRLINLGLVDLQPRCPHPAVPR